MCTYNTKHPKFKNATIIHPYTCKRKYPVTNIGFNTKFVTIIQHKSEEDALKYVYDNLNNRTWAVINMHDTGKNDYFHVEDVQFTIRMNYTTIPNTNTVQENLKSKGYAKYYLSGF